MGLCSLRRESSAGTLNLAYCDASSLSEARTAAPWCGLLQNQEREIMRGNFRTMKGNPLPPVQPSLGNSPRQEAAASNAAVGI